jgi:hypothetical protein
VRLRTQALSLAYFMLTAVLLLGSAAAIYFAREYFVNGGRVARSAVVFVGIFGFAMFWNHAPVVVQVANKLSEAARSHHGLLRLAPGARLVHY